MGGHNEDHSVGLSRRGQELCCHLGHSAEPSLCVCVGMNCLQRKRKGGAGDWSNLRRWRVVCTRAGSGIPPPQPSHLSGGPDVKGHVWFFPVTNSPGWLIWARWVSSCTFPGQGAISTIKYNLNLRHFLPSLLFKFMNLSAFLCVEFSRLCPCLCADTVLLSVRICDQHVQTEGRDYCQLLPF